jgi:FkbM family methyltransferase
VLEPFLDKGVEESIFRTGTYERGTLSVIQNVLKPGDRFVDIGANVGLMTLVAAKTIGAGGRVDSFEPLPEIRRLLELSIEQNRFSNIFLHELALGSAPSRMAIHRHPEVNRGSASLAWTSQENDSLDICLETLDRTIYNLSSQPIAMMKIDVEGWELEVLRGGISTLAREPQPVLCIEFSRLHPLQGGKPEDMIEFLSKLGYQPYRLQKSKSAPSPLISVNIENIPDHDNLFFFPVKRLTSIEERLFKYD